MDLQQLKAPFQAHEHDFNYQRWAYVSEEAISNRLDDVCGMDRWRLVQVSPPQQVTQTHYIAVVSLDILTDNGWASRVGTGEGTTSIGNPYTTNKGEQVDPLQDPRYMTNAGENAAKSAATDAFRRAARLWGIGRYLLSLPKDKYGKPTVQNEAQLEAWLNNLHSPSGSDGNKNKPSGNQSKSNTPKSTPQETAGERVGKHERLKAELREYTPVVMLKHIKASPKQKKAHRWMGIASYDGHDDLLITLWEEDIAAIMPAIGKAGLKRNQEYAFTHTHPLHIKVTADKYGPKLLHIINDMSNPAIYKAFMDRQIDTPDDAIKKALQVVNIEDYKGTWHQAMSAVKAYTEGQEPSNITPIGAGTAFQASVDNLKQQRLIDARRVEELG